MPNQLSHGLLKIKMKHSFSFFEYMKNESGSNQVNQPSANSNTAESTNIAPHASPSPTPPANGTGAGVIRGGTGIHFNESAPRNTFSQNARVIRTRSSRPLFIATEIIAERAPDVSGEGSSSSSTGGGFDLTQMAINLPPPPPQPHLVEDRAREEAAQGREDAAEPRVAIREDVVPVVRRYRVPDLNLPQPGEDEELGKN